MGSLESVLGTRAAWIGKHEVVEVSFRSSEAAYAGLLAAAVEKGCAARVWTTTDAQHEVATKRVGDRAERFDGEVRVAKDSDQLYYLERSAYRHLPLTPLQARRVNGALFVKGEPKEWLSPRQGELLTSIEARLKTDAEAFDALQRPATIDELADYESALRERLK